MRIGETQVLCIALSVVMDVHGGSIEVQGAAECAPVPRQGLDRLPDLAAEGVLSAVRKEREVLRCAGTEV